MLESNLMPRSQAAEGSYVEEDSGGNVIVNPDSSVQGTSVTTGTYAESEAVPGAA
jgi:ribosomal protein L14